MPGPATIDAARFPYEPEIASEARDWREIADLIRGLTSEERLEPGYFTAPDWSVRDLAAHLGTWLAQADRQFQQMLAGTYRPEPVDVDGLNAALLEAMRDQPWDVAWSQANAARTMMVDAWHRLPARSADADWWIEKAGPAHYAQHLPRLRAWVAELVARRADEASDAG
ncbi:MAG TPA: hypothetical protein VK656_04320 [Candidatus Acidoferrum sp.]|nr:hypothetical protein [Candidatus Acidoferrum sp.]